MTSGKITSARAEHGEVIRLRDRLRESQNRVKSQGFRQLTNTLEVALTALNTAIKQIEQVRDLYGHSQEQEPELPLLRKKES